jgi:uncharacterized protein YdaU (DUF1376 family)
MHYYQFNIGDYASHTAHLDPLEDIAYRRMLDYCYLNECGLPETIESIARVIRMRTHCDCIATVLQEFFYERDDGTWHHTRVDNEILAYKGKSAKASESARKRWDNVDANALRTQSEGNANHKPITNNHKPITSKETTTSRANALDYGCWPSIPSDQVLKDWLDMRKRLKANVSQTVINNFATEFNKAAGFGYSVDQCLSEAVTRNWRGFKFDWMQEKQNAAHQRSNRETLSERANRAADEAFGTGSQSRVLEGCFDILNDNGADQLTGSRGLPDLGQRSG